MAGCGASNAPPPGAAETGGVSVGDGSESGGSTESGESGSTGDDGQTVCEEPCEGECIEGTCCPLLRACDDICCGETEVCSFGQCVVPGAECVDATECADGEYCEYSLGEPGGNGQNGMCQGGVMPATGKCLPSPPECPPGVEPEGDDIDCLPLCEVIPTSSFDPQLKYHWSAGDSMMTPIVLQLDDDDCNGVIDERDIPEIVFSTFENGAYTQNGTLRAISIVGGQVVDKWSVHPETARIHPGLSIAGGNIDGTPGNEIVVCTDDGAVRAFDHDGSHLWLSDAVGCFMPSLADLDQDGTVEVLVERAVLDGATGLVEANFAAQPQVVAADVDDDGMLEIVGPAAAFEADGTPIVDLTTALGIVGYAPAVADFDGDGAPEVATIDNATHSLLMWRIDPASPTGYTVIRQGININGSFAACTGDTGGGPPTIADFDGDGTPDVGVAAGVGYAVFGGAELMNPAILPADTLLWLTPAVDCSSRVTGSSVFDFDGNGNAEVVYGDEQYLRIYDGATGAVLFETCNTTGTLWELPLVADVDNDGHADIVAISNSYSGITCPLDGSQQRGVRVFGDLEGRWVRTRRIWNQHAYHVTNVEEDGSIPAIEVANWTVPSLNNFRQNVQPEGEFSAPDLIATILGQCSGAEYAVVARVRNIGQASVPAGVAVGFFEGDPDQGGTFLGQAATTKALYPAEAEDVVLPVPNASDALRNGSVDVHVILDYEMPAHAWHECRTDNNHASGPAPCIVPG